MKTQPLRDVSLCQGGEMFGFSRLRELGLLPAHLTLGVPKVNARLTLTLGGLLCFICEVKCTLNITSQ